MTVKFDNFKVELIDLCRKHNVRLCASVYEEIEVRDLLDECEEITEEYFIDVTEGSEEYNRA